MGDRCATCNAPLAVDQRYCVECGERRGKARFPVGPGPTESVETGKRPPRAHTRPRLSSGATLVAGVATLLLAMGLGLLIGRSSNQPASSRSPGVQVVTVQGSGGGGVASTAATTTAAATPPAARKSAPAAAAAAAVAAKVDKKVAKVLSKPATAAAAKKANAAASKVLGNGQNLAPATVSTGQTCTSGAGCQGGHFTGTFFPGG